MTNMTMTPSKTTTLPDDDTLRMWSIKLSAKHREWLRVEAFRRRCTMSDVVREMIDRAMEEQEEAA